jgi:hypothetical protein
MKIENPSEIRQAMQRQVEAELEKLTESNLYFFNGI